VSPLTDEELMTLTIQEEIKQLDAAIEKKIGSIRPALEVKKEFNKSHLKVPEDIFLLEQVDEEDEAVKGDATVPEAVDCTHESYDKYLMVEVHLPNGGELVRAKVKACKWDHNGTPIRKSHSNQFWTLAFMRLSFRMDQQMHSLLMPLLSLCTHRLMTRAIPTS
jgi:hypothetical protein